MTKTLLYDAYAANGGWPPGFRLPYAMNVAPHPTPVTIESALSAAMRAFDTLERLVQAGAVGPDIDELLDGGRDVLTVVEAELARLLQADHPEAFEAAAVLRRRLDALRNELGSSAP